VSRKKEMAIHTRHVADIEHGRFVRRTRPELVRVMARAEGYAMVRLSGCVPFVVSEKDLASAPQDSGSSK
jgi:hypothetical protein